MKKLAFVFAAVVAVSFASCDSKATQNDAATQDDQPSTELTEGEKDCEDKACTKCDTCTCNPCSGDSCQAEAAEPATTPCDPA